MSDRLDRGVVLVAVLFAVAIMSVMVVAASALTRSGIAGHELEQRRLATRKRCKTCSTSHAGRCTRK